MDVKCNRCGTDYEFEETLVSARGTTVKCTTCGHLFKVFRGGNPEQTPADDSRPWLVRKRNGTVEPLVSLGDLTRMIGRQEITPDDEISRSGQAWKKLGEIAELQSFFANPMRAQAAQSATPALGLESPSTRPPRNSDTPLPIGVGSMPPTSRTDITQTERRPTAPSQRPPAARSVEPQRVQLPTPTLAVDEPPGDQHTPHERPSARSRAKARKSATDSGGSQPPATKAPPAPAPPTPATPSARPPAVPSGPPAVRPTPAPPPPPPIATQPTEVAAEKRIPWGRVTALVALVGLGMGAYFWARRLAVEPPPTTSPAQPFITRADEALALHDVRRFGDAVTDFTKALAFNERDVAVVVRLSRAYAVWAEALENVARSDALRAVDARVERKRHVANARRQADLALLIKPGDVEAEVAMADALRLDGEINAARGALTRAGEPSNGASAETLRVAALLAAAESDGDLTRAVELATRAVQKDPDLIRAELLLAGLLLASGEIPSAREHVRTVLAGHPSHRLAEMLLSAIEAKAVAVNVAPTATANAADAATTVDAGSAPDAGAAAEAADPAAVLKRAIEELPNSYDELIRRGDSLLERGAVRLAKAAFEKALGLRPGAAPALTGLGYLALERGDAAGAIRLFTPASNSGHGDAFIGLGDASRQIGRQDDALRAYESYLSRYPSGPRASIARRQVERLREQARPSAPAGFGPPRQTGTSP